MHKVDAPSHMTKELTSSGVRIRL